MLNFAKRPVAGSVVAFAFLLVVSWGVLFLSQCRLFAGSGDTGSSAGEKPLRLELAVALGEQQPALLVMRAANVSKDPVSVVSFGLHGNHLAFTTPDGKEESGAWTGPVLKSEVIRAGEVREWTYPADDSGYFQKPGLYKVAWQVEGQTSNELLLLRRPKLNKQ